MDLFCFQKLLTGLPHLIFQAIAAARLKEEYPERVGQPECQVLLHFHFSQ